MDIKVYGSVAELTVGTGLAGRVAVVIDVLRATSTIATALSAGATRVRPVLTPAAAMAAAGELSPAPVLGGERGGLRISGFHLGNSPREYTPETVAGREVILTTTNGTRTLLQAAGAASVCTASFLNLGAAVAFLVSQQRDVALCCAGTQDQFSLDDGLCAGALTARLMAAAGAAPCDLGLAMAELYRLAGGKVERLLADCRHGRRLLEIGMGDDIAFCAEEDALAVTPVWQNGALMAWLP